MNEGAVRFRGWIAVRREGEGPLGLTLIGHTQDRPEELVQLAFAARAPEGIPDALEDAVVERIGAREYRITSDGRQWMVSGTAHSHREIAAAFYQAIPARPVPWTKRLFWRVVLGLAARPVGRWLLNIVR